MICAFLKFVKICKMGWCLGIVRLTKGFFFNDIGAIFFVADKTAGKTYVIVVGAGGDTFEVLPQHVSVTDSPGNLNAKVCTFGLLGGVGVS